jgi:hypothetical protein
MTKSIGSEVVVRVISPYVITVSGGASESKRIKSFDMIESEINDILAESWTIISPQITGAPTVIVDYAEETVINLAIELYGAYSQILLDTFAETGNQALWELNDLVAQRRFNCTVVN